MIHNKMLKRTQLKPKDVLVSIAGTIGNTAIIPKELGEANINQAIALLRLKKSITLKNKKEIELLPEHFSKLEPKDRIELLTKLLPYALPKIEPESYKLGESDFFEWDI